MPKIVINAAHLNANQMDGITRYGIETLRHLYKVSTAELITFASHLPLNFIQHLKPAPRVLSEFNLKGNLSRLIWNQTVLRMKIKSENAKLYYSMLPEGMFYPPCPQIITVHDVLPLVYPEVYPRLKYYFRSLLPKIIRSSAAVIVISDFVKKEVQKYFEIPAEKIHVVHQGYRNEVFFPQAPEKVAAVKKKFALDNFILCVGETRKYKNMRAMIHAFSKISSPGLKLAIAGNINRLEKDLLQLPAELKVAERVTFLGRVSDEELASLYSGAACFVFPSLYEGFGLPLLEAMACGCPVVASRQASIPEVCGDAAIFFDPNEIEDIRSALLRVLEDNGLAEDIRTKGIKRTRLFNQRSSVEQIDKIFGKYL